MSHPLSPYGPLSDEVRLDALLTEAEAFHGHICGGIVIGLRMAMEGLRQIGIRDPKGADAKDFLVFVEIDRCATDAITVVTGCRPGKRTMKLRDYGKMAATFVNLKDQHAVRLSTLDSPDPAEAPEACVVRLKRQPAPALFRIQQVEVNLAPGDLPGRPVRTARCEQCGETVLDARDVTVDGNCLCLPCAEGERYYRVIGEVRP